MLSIFHFSAFVVVIVLIATSCCCDCSNCYKIKSRWAIVLSPDHTSNEKKGLVNSGRILIGLSGRISMCQSDFIIIIIG